MTPKELKYHKLYMDIAKRFAEMSYAKRLKVGALLVRDDIVISHGWNGMPSGLENECENIHSEPYDENGILRGIKIVYFTKDEVLHAEQNCIVKAAKHGISTKDSTLYTTHAPCIQCSKLIQQSGINRVVFLETYRNTDGLELLQKCNIEVINLNESTT